jgi:heparan-alpha-glucosaminide N-acetyltransferase
MPGFTSTSLVSTGCTITVAQGASEASNKQAPNKSDAVIDMSSVMQPAAISQEFCAPSKKAQRYVALDAYRGFIMLMLASDGFGFAYLRNNPQWGRVASWFDHVPWDGTVFWDMIQPAFMFMVGVAMPFAMARRIAAGATWNDNLRHVLGRSVRLIIMSQIVIWVGAGHTKPQLINVLSQIAFTYLLSFLIMQSRLHYQIIAAVGLLVLWTMLLFSFHGPGGPYSKTDSVGLLVDRAIFHYDYDPAYSMLNFIPSTVWTLTGVWVGRLLMTARSHKQKLQVLAAGMILAFATAFALMPSMPMIKQLCTPTFTFYSLGWVLFMLIGFYLLIEVCGWSTAAWPLVVVGMNSIFIYSASEMLHKWLDSAVGVFTFHFRFIGTLAPVAQATAVLLVMWYLCYWLYRRQIFLKL